MKLVDSKTGKEVVFTDWNGVVVRDNLFDYAQEIPDIIREHGDFDSNELAIPKCSFQFYKEIFERHGWETV